MKNLTYFAAAAWLASAAPPAPRVTPAALASVGPGAVWTPPADFDFDARGKLETLSIVRVQPRYR